MDTSAFDWPVILALGIWHGINPGMGWLFAVALGLQERRAGAVWRALLPLAVGHGAAIVAALAIAAAAGQVLPLEVVKWITAIVLVGAGIYRLRSHGHGRYVGMQVTGRALAVWSMMMASAHGAGLMVVPFVQDSMGPGVLGSASGHGAHLASVVPASGVANALAATGVHAVGYLLTTAIIAMVVYQKVGLQFLRRMWVNLDLVWAVALIVTGLATPLL